MTFPFTNFAQQRADKIKERRMSDQTQHAGQPPVMVAADTSDRLAQLHAAYDAAAARAAEANAHLDAIKTGIKAELAVLAPEGSTRITLTGPHGPSLGLTYSESWRVDSRKLKREDPETYVRYATKSGSWTLRALSGGASE